MKAGEEGVAGERSFWHGFWCWCGLPNAIDRDTRHWPLQPGLAPDDPFPDAVSEQLIDWWQEQQTLRPSDKPLCLGHVSLVLFGRRCPFSVGCQPSSPRILPVFI